MEGNFNKKIIVCTTQDAKLVKTSKNEYKEITQKQYFEIIDTINNDKDATPFINKALFN